MNMIKEILQEAISSNNRVERSWGFYITFKEIFNKENVIYKEKILYISPKSKISLQKHSSRDEIWMSEKTFHYSLEDEFGEVFIHKAKPLERVYIPKDKKHNIINKDDSSLIIFEIQTGICDELDIVRF